MMFILNKKNSMRKISFLMILCIAAIILLFATCDNPCKIKYLKDVKPIDWENYNDVYTVYWNYVHVSGSKQAHNMRMDEGKEIMIYGWVTSQHANSIPLFDLSESPNGGIHCPVAIALPAQDPYILVNLRTKLDTCDLTKKCFIKGKLKSGELFNGNYFCKGQAYIMIEYFDNVYFE